MKRQIVEYGGQRFTHVEHAMRLPIAAAEELAGILQRWQSIFPAERTRINARHGVPSLFVRFDCVISPAGKLDIYEIQEGCAWVGYAGIANPAFCAVRDEIVSEEWPGLKVLRADDQTDIDDDLWVPRASVEEAIASDAPLIVRGGIKHLPDDERAVVIGKSVRPVLLHNDKRYGKELGWWRLVWWRESRDGEALPWDEEFVLKPQFSFGSRDIMLWRPDERKSRSTRTQIIRTLKRRNGMYLQRFIPPMKADIDGAPYHVIYRPYFLYSGRAQRWVPAHGVWTARPAPTIRIHGASDAISGPLIIE